MNPIEIAKNRCPKIGLSETELKGALFFLAGINSFARLDADDSERNKLFDYSSVGPFEPDDELPNNVSERSGSIYREIINLFDEENRFGLYESSSSREHEIIKLPAPLLFEEFKSVDLKLGETHKLFIKISQEFGNLLKNQN